MKTRFPRAIAAAVVAVLLPLSAVASSQDETAPSATGVGYRVAFDSASDAASLEFTPASDSKDPSDAPKIEDQRLRLLLGVPKSTTAVGLRAPSEGPMRVIEATFTLVMQVGSEGCGFAWLDAARFGASGAAPAVEGWEAPSLPGSFGLGFDASNPVSSDPFHGSGNVYDRPQHEASLHWDGAEVMKKVTATDFRDEQPHDVSLRLEFVTGGAEVTLRLDQEVVFDRFFIPSMTAFTGRPAFGARNDETAGEVWLDEFSVACREAVPVPEPPVRIVALDAALNDRRNPRNDAEVAFPQDTARFGRIVCVLRLDQPESRFDPWDRIAHLYAFADDGERFELLRYITPYHRGYEWKVDVSDFRPLLTGLRRIRQACVTQGSGWRVTVRFDFYPGPTDRLAYRVVNLWSGKPEIGNPKAPVDAFYQSKSVALDPSTAFAKVRLVVTGHGQEPNTGNAAEFLPLGRTLTVNGESFRNLLWKADNYLNPCRPQGGTWKFDRAGWAPGDVVRAWEVDVSHLLAEKELRVAYTLDPYVNEGRGKSGRPTHLTESHVVLYRRAE